MTAPSHHDEHAPSHEDSQSADGDRGEHKMSDDAARRALDQGDREKIDRTLKELHVSTTNSGKDQSQKSDTEGSNSSSKNIDEQND